MIMKFYDGNGNLIDISSQESVGSSLKGKKWCACGDSVTYGATADTDSDGNLMNYQYFIAKRNGMNLVTNAVNGCTMSDCGDSRPAFVNGRYLNVPLDCDYLTLWFGINDSNAYLQQNYDISLGQMGDTDTKTFYGAYDMMLNYFVTNMPNCKIGLVASHTCASSYCEAVRELAKKYGLKVFDIQKDSNIPYWADTSYGASEVDSEIKTQRASDWWTNNSHPNTAGYEYISYPFEHWLRSL